MFQPFSRGRKHDGETAGDVPDGVTLRNWSTMETALILYAICAPAVLVSITLLRDIRKCLGDRRIPLSKACDLNCFLRDRYEPLEYVVW